MKAITAIILAAGEGRRMGGDKALLQLGGETLLQRVVNDCRAAGLDQLVVVRRQGADPLPEMPAQVAAPVSVQAPAPVQVVEVASGQEMIHSIRAGLSAATSNAVLVLPVDYALVGAETLALLCARLRVLDNKVLLPLCEDCPGHPIGLCGSVLQEVQQAASLRHVMVADAERVETQVVRNPWIHWDLDTPEDLQRAQAELRSVPMRTVEVMRRHRSRRSYHPDPIPADQLQWLVDSARYASTSSFIQAYAVVAVQDAKRKAEVAALCKDLQQIHEAPVFLAICADLHKLQLCCQQHGGELQSHSMELFLQASVDAALLGQNLLLAAESQGLDGCMIGAARTNPQKLAQLLALPPHAYVVFGMVLGKAKDEPVARGRMPLAGVLHLEQYQADALPAVLDGMDQVMRQWAQQTNAAGGYEGRPVNEEKGWTERMARLWGRERKFRESLEQELRRLGFGLARGDSEPEN